MSVTVGRDGREYKIVLLGPGGVGKSALSISYVYERFIERYDPTIEDMYRKTVQVDNVRCQVEILDTAGIEQFLSLSGMYMKTGDGFILVFSLSSADSVHELARLRTSILRTKEAQGLAPAQVPIVLVGNKCDLVEQRQVPRSVGVTLSQEWNSVPYYETSARKRIQVEEIFIDIMRQILRRDASLVPGTPAYQAVLGNKKKKRSCYIL